LKADLDARFRTANTLPVWAESTVQASTDQNVTAKLASWISIHVAQNELEKKKAASDALVIRFGFGECL
jgi:hypothetical protein